MAPPHKLPLVVTLNCIEEPTLEQSSLNSVAQLHHIPLSHLSSSPLPHAAAVLLHSLAFLPRAAQRLLRPHHLILCLGSSDKALDSALALDLGLTKVVHVDVGRGEEVADTVMALVLGLLRRTHLLSRRTLSASGWLGAVQPLCRGMRRCRGLVLGIIGRSASAKCLAKRSLAFEMSVLYFDVKEGDGRLSRASFPPAARRMDTLNDLLAASDVISLHCALTDDTVQIINAECLQHVKPGAFLVNTGSAQLLDDCAVKQFLIDGILAGCALDGAEGPQWMEAWIREMPNVLILPRSADFSEEVWMEIREKAISLLHGFFLDGTVPESAVSDEEEEENVIDYEKEQPLLPDSGSQLQLSVDGQLTEDIHLTAASSQKKVMSESNESSSHHQDPPLSNNVTSRSEAKRSRSNKKAKRRHARQRSQHKVDDPSTLERESTSLLEDVTALSGTDQVLSSSSRFASPEDIQSRRADEYSSEPRVKLNIELPRKPGELVKDGYIVALHARDYSLLHVSRQRVKGGGWFLDTLSSVTKRDPAAQFLIVVHSKDTIGLRSFTAGGKLLQINRRMEFVFASHSFDVWESWMIEGTLEECRLVNCRNPQATLEVRVEVLAAVGEDEKMVLLAGFISSNAKLKIIGDAKDWVNPPLRCYSRSKLMEWCRLLDGDLC
ncbi:hypothetical protein LIER_06028 [Lithospermum erythrorhizon]|uniref:D-isomer specific 2-hydroxyacid dehydrogenase NAD-binding domain-containing protein n=1 Tax=Lithospermum erythrorhizon TaxID=34254 RepID=A0AAV3P2R0_LITER